MWNFIEQIPFLVKWLKFMFWLGIAGIIAGLFIERAIPSIGIFTVFGAALLLRGPVVLFRSGWKEPLFILMALLVVLPLLSGLWSADTADWWKRITLKAPLLVVPLATAGWCVHRKLYFAISAFWIAVVAAGCTWSLSQLWINYAFYRQAYLEAKVIPTPFYNDHIRFSWVVVAMLLLLLKLWRMGAFQARWQRFAAIALAGFFVVFLHMLAARTGLLSLYLAAGVLALAYILVKRRYLLGTALIGLLALMPVLAWNFSGTFKNRIQFLRYDFYHFATGQYNEGLTDAPRVYSLRAGWDIFRTHPHLGIGFGDINNAAQQWYSQHAPQLPQAERLLPGSDWLLYAAGLGWPGWLVFIIAVTLLFFLRSMRGDLTWYALWAISWLALLYEIPIEGQVGVALYSILPVWWRMGQDDRALPMLSVL